MQDGNPVVRQHRSRSRASEIVRDLLFSLLWRSVKIRVDCIHAYAGEFSPFQKKKALLKAMEKYPDQVVTHTYLHCSQPFENLIIVPQCFAGS